MTKKLKKAWISWEINVEAAMSFYRVGGVNSMGEGRRRCMGWSQNTVQMEHMQTQYAEPIVACVGETADKLFKTYALDTASPMPDLRKVFLVSFPNSPHLSAPVAAG